MNANSCPNDLEKEKKQKNIEHSFGYFEMRYFFAIMIISPSFSIIRIAFVRPMTNHIHGSTDEL